MSTREERRGDNRLKKIKAIKYILSQRLSDEERLLLLTLAGNLHKSAGLP